MKKEQSGKQMKLNRKTVAVLKGKQLAVLNGGGIVTGQQANDSIRVVPCPASPLCMETFWQSCNCVNNDDTVKI